MAWRPDPALCQHRGNPLDEVRRSLDRLARAIDRHACAKLELVIGNRFQVIGSLQKQGEVGRLRFAASELRPGDGGPGGSWRPSRCATV